MQVTAFILASFTFLSSTTAQLNFDLTDLGSISQLTYRDLGNMYSLETRSLTDKYDILTSRSSEASAQAIPSGIFSRVLVRAAGEAFGVPNSWLPAVEKNVAKLERNVVYVREANPEESLEATLVHRSPTPCSYS